MSLRNDLLTVCRLNYGRYSMADIHRALREVADDADSDPTTETPDNHDCKSLAELALGGIK